MLASHILIVGRLSVDSWVQCARHCATLLRLLTRTILESIPHRVIRLLFSLLHNVSDKRIACSVELGVSCSIVVGAIIVDFVVEIPKIIALVLV